MAFDFYMPDIGEGVVEGEIVAWKVKEGDKVKLDQPLVEIMTDKATVEIPSPRAGTITKINFKEGEICPVGNVLVVIDDGGGVPAAKGNGHERPDRPDATRPHTAPPPPTASVAGIQVVAVSHERTRVLATPATRRLARELGVELGRVPATGKHGRVTTDDVKRFKDQPAAARTQAL